MSMTTEEALLKARVSGIGPIFMESQLQRLSDWCKQQGVDSNEFIPAYTDYVIASFAATSTAAEMATQVELAVTQVPDVKLVLDLYQKKLKRRPSGDSPAEKLKRKYRALDYLCLTLFRGSLNPEHFMTSHFFSHLLHCWDCSDNHVSSILSS